MVLIFVLRHSKIEMILDYQRGMLCRSDQI